MKGSLSRKFENAVRLLTKHIPPSNKASRKPILFHDIRVGVYLYQNGYKENIVLAGVLHDAIEWSKISEKMLRNAFGNRVANLVLANTKDDSIKDKDKKITDLITRCVENGQDALIVKAADILDSFKWYSDQNNRQELQYCLKNAEAILKFKPKNFDDKIFKELKTWQNSWKT